jgi:DNA helicase HerA-like ATPase
MPNPSDPAATASEIPTPDGSAGTGDGSGGAAAAAGNPVARRIADGYATSAPCVTLGSVVVDGVADPGALVRIPLAMFNRHGLVAGATGTGKTKTLQGIAEQLSAAGVPVLMPDIKGDLSGLHAPGTGGAAITARAADTGDQWTAQAFPVEFLSLAGQGGGVQLRATVDSFGPILLSKVLGLNETQESTLGLIFHWCDQQHLPLLDIKDLREVIGYLTGDEGKAELKKLGGVSTATSGVILRAVTNLAAQGGDRFFGEPEFDIADLMRTAPVGRAVIILLAVGDLQTRPALFSTFLMWLLAELFEHLPEVGDVDKPKLVFLFDEAHLLFDDASKAFLDAIEQTVKLIRSKGVGVFFCSQLPTDVPGPVLSQLGARIQHALRAFTPADQDALATTVKTYPVTEDYDLAKALTSLGIGEAIVTVLSEKGAPTPVAWTRMRAPRSLMDPIPDADLAAAVAASPVAAKYGVAVDRQSAYEMLTARLAQQQADADAAAREETGSPGDAGSYPGPDAGSSGPAGPADNGGAGGVLTEIMGNTVVKSFMRSMASAIGGALGRSIFGTRSRRSSSRSSRRGGTSRRRR